MIEVENLTKKYGERTAVNRISFSVRKGEVIGFLGPNGAGKSTTLRMLTGYLKPTAGSIRVNGIDAVRDPIGARRSIGYLPESVPLYGEMRVDEYLRYRASLKGVRRSQVAGRVDASLQLANVADVRHRIIGQLSKGYRSRVGIADAIVADPPLLVLDEPTAGLDPNQIRQVRDLIRAIAGDKTVMLSTHILPEVESTCGRVLIINRGELVGEGAPGELRVAEQGGQLLLVESRGERDRIEAILRAVPGVRGLREVLPLEAADAALFRIRIEVDGPAVAEAVSASLAAAGLPLRELHREQSTLEDVFATLTTRDLAHEPIDAEPPSQPIAAEGP
ncbi:MAG TPA: ATP-binding cassette domain-containing protein [Polyangiales bacterium]|nr:ATP-binding cassette domain-containing protein [Polyangiales bacterium]